MLLFCFVRCIDDCARGRLCAESLQLLQSMNEHTSATNGRVIHLAGTNRTVSQINVEELYKMPGDPVILKSRDVGLSAVLDRETPLEKELVLKLHAPVIVTVNIDSNIVNGSR